MDPFSGALEREEKLGPGRVAMQLLYDVVRYGPLAFLCLVLPRPHLQTDRKESHKKGTRTKTCRKKERGVTDQTEKRQGSS